MSLGVYLTQATAGGDGIAAGKRVVELRRTATVADPQTPSWFPLSPGIMLGAWTLTPK
jgi:hypothetical protein